MAQGMGKGYLESDFRVFYLSSISDTVVPMHYHDYRQIMILIDGAIDYAVEDRHYSMSMGDVILVDAGCMHRPLLARTSTYERIIIYLSDVFFTARPGLDELFLRAQDNQNYLLYVQPEGKKRVICQAKDLTDKACSKSRFPLLLQQSRINEFLIELNDIAASSDGLKEQKCSCNKNVQTVIRYINDHLPEDLSTAKIAESVHLTESYLMHLFKNETGKTIRNYVMEKRLYLSSLYLSKGYSAAETCTLSGFSSYSSFYRAYMDRYGTSPRTIGGLEQPVDGREPVE